MAGRVAIFFQILLFLISPMKSLGRVEVHLAYVDQEVASLLESITRRENKNVPVIAVSNYGVSESRMFGFAPEHFTSKKIRILQVPGAVDDSAEAQVARSIASSTSKNGGPAEIENAYMPGAKSMSTAHSSYVVANLNSSHGGQKQSKKDVIIVLQSPEFGRQPKLLQAHLKVLFEALSQLPQAKPENGGIHLSSFGTSGGVSSNLHPGDIDHVKGSMFVGVEIVPRTRPPKYVARVVYASLEKKEEDEIFRSPALDSLQEAEGAAREAFLKLAESVKSPASCASGDDAASFLHVLKATAVENLKNCLSKSDTSLTVSFFATAPIKDAAARLGISNVNMEDFHIIRSLRMTQRGHSFSSVSLNRVIADPSTISPHAKAKLNTWLKEGSYSDAEFEDALLWGLNGAKLSQPPASAAWKAFIDIPAGDIKKLMNQIPIGKTKAPIDPFYHGVAENFLNQVSKPEFLSGLLAPIDRSSEGDPNYASQQRALFEKSKVLKKMVDQIRLAKNGPESQVRAHLRELIDECKSLTVNDETSKTISLLAKSADPAQPSKLKIPLLVEGTLQLRGGTSGDLANRLDQDKLERMFYRHSLIGLTQSSTEKFVRDQSEFFEKAAAAVNGKARK